MAYKSEKTWKDLERADKVAIIVAVVLWAALETGVFVQSVGGISKIKQIAKTEMVRSR